MGRYGFVIKRLVSLDDKTVASHLSPYYYSNYSQVPNLKHPITGIPLLKQPDSAPQVKQKIIFIPLSTNRILSLMK